MSNRVGTLGFQGKSFTALKQVVWDFIGEGFPSDSALQFVVSILPNSLKLIANCLARANLAIGVNCNCDKLRVDVQFTRCIALLGVYGQKGCIIILPTNKGAFAVQKDSPTQNSFWNICNSE